MDTDALPWRVAVHQWRCCCLCNIYGSFHAKCPRHCTLPSSSLFSKIVDNHSSGTFAFMKHFLKKKFPVPYSDSEVAVEGEI